MLDTAVAQWLARKTFNLRVDSSSLSGSTKHAKREHSLWGYNSSGSESALLRREIGVQIIVPPQRIAFNDVLSSSKDTTAVEWTVLIRPRVSTPIASSNLAPCTMTICHHNRPRSSTGRALVYETRS